jgi:hypothetical protein
MISRDPIDPDSLDKARFQIELEALAYDPGKKASHRMRLPAGGFCERCDRRASGGAQHFYCSRLLRAGSDRCNVVALLPRIAGLRSVARWCSRSRRSSLLCCLCHRDLLRFGCSLSGCTAEAPQKPLSRRGGIPERQKRAGSKHSSAPITAKCQSFLDNLVAQTMTSFAFILGVVPLVIATGAGSEMRQALGTAVFFGMLGVTCLHTDILRVRALDW